MSWRNLIGVLICVIIFLLSFYLGGNVRMYFNVPALLAVVSGTIGAAFLSYPFSRLMSAFYVAKNSYLVKLPTQDSIVKSLLDLSVKSRYDGVLSLEKAQGQASATFLKGALGLLVDGYKEHEIRDILTTEVYFFKERRAHNERVFRTLARFSPAFGLIGSIIGLIGMLAGIGDTGIILKTIPIALMATLYGILFANFVFTPIAESVYARTQQEMLLQKIIINGVLAIKVEQNPHKLEKKLTSFLTPASRPSHEKSFDDIKKKYLKMRLEEKEKDKKTA